MTFPMELGSNEWMMIWGSGLVVLALFIMWRIANYDLAGAAFDSAWQVARGQRSAANPTAIEQKLQDINAEASLTGKAKRAAGTIVGHFVAKILGTLAMLMLAVGLGLLAAGFFWR